MDDSLHMKQNFCVYKNYHFQKDKDGYGQQCWFCWDNLVSQIYVEAWTRKWETTEKFYKDVRNQ